MQQILQNRFANNEMLKEMINVKFWGVVLAIIVAVLILSLL